MDMSHQSARSSKTWEFRLRFWKKRADYPFASGLLQRSANTLPFDLLLMVSSAACERAERIIFLVSAHGTGGSR